MKNKFTPTDAIKGFLIALFSYLTTTLIILIVQTSIALAKGVEEFTMTKPAYFISSLLIEASFLVCLLFVGRKKKLFTELKLTKKPNLKILLICIAISLITLVSFISFNNLFLFFLEKIGCNTTSSSTYLDNVGDLLLSILVLAVTPAICEEVLFRGVCTNGLREKGKWFSIIVSAILFMVIHLGLSQSIYQVILGIIFAYVFYQTNSLWYSIIMHFLNNCFVLVVTFLTKSNSTTPTFTTFFDYALPFVFLIIGGVVVFMLLKLLNFSIKKLENQDTNLNQDNSTNVVAQNQNASVYDQNMKKLEDIYFKKIFVLCAIITVTIYLIAVIASFY
ncbi:MAG: CPBP family intramembrane metalloprotease [Clostridia bacterium]|nr:CPBP family intramembrane metalloprotease [Clostridia bacterium]